MQIPNKVKIGGLVYDIEVKETIRRGRDYTGEIDFQNCKIELKNCAMVERSFLHEILHGIFADLGYDEHDEKQIDELAGALYAFVVDNPEVFT